MERIDNATSQTDWIVNCSDDEFSESKDQVNEAWAPSPDEIITLYEALDAKGILELEWECPGRRSPSVHPILSEFPDKTSPDDDCNTQIEPNEFDFDDDFSVDHFSPKIEPRKRGTQANSAQKRVARLDKVMNDIQRHRKLDELELQRVASQVSKSGSPSLKKTKSPGSTGSAVQ